jgi:RNA polymerase sigma-70 factor (ECF subfamily)
MPDQRSKALHFDSWKELLRWLPRASESQLMTVFVWSGDQSKVPPDDARDLAEVRRQSFELLVGRTRDRLRRYLERRQHCRDPFLADDVVQDVLIQLYRRAEMYDPSKSFWGWLYRVARNKYIDTLRRTRPGDIGSGQTHRPDEALDAWMQNAAVTTATAESAALEQERRQRVEAAIARLPSAQRDIVRQKLDGVQGKEIARRMGKSQAYVSQAYHEALEWVRDVVDE